MTLQTFNPQTDFVVCPHCAHMLDHWTLDLWKCPNDSTVYDASGFVPVSRQNVAIGVAIADDHLPLCSIAGNCD